MRAFGAVVAGAVLAVLDSREDRALRGAIACALLRDAPPWDVLAPVAELTNALLGRLRGALLIHCPPAIRPRRIDRDAPLIQMPRVARARPAPTPGIGRGVAARSAPWPDRCLRYPDPPCTHELFHALGHHGSCSPWAAALHGSFPWLCLARTPTLPVIPADPLCPLGSRGIAVTRGVRARAAIPGRDVERHPGSGRHPGALMHATRGERCWWRAEAQGQHGMLFHAAWRHHVQRSRVLAPCGARHAGCGHGWIPSPGRGFWAHPGVASADVGVLSIRHPSSCETLSPRQSVERVPSATANRKV